MSQEINRVALRSKVVKAIQKAPYKGVFSRCVENKYHKKEEQELFTITGIRYSETASNIVMRITTEDSGVIFGKNNTKFLVAWDDNSKEVKKGDYVTIDDVKYIIKDTGNVFEICCDMIIEEV